MDIYTLKQWETDRNFKAQPGQEITEAVYEEMLNCAPPLKLPREKVRQALQDYKITVYAGFLMGEPHSSDRNGQYFLAFGANGKRFYYLGLSLPIREKAAYKEKAAD